VLMPKENLVFAISGRGLFEGLYAYRDDPAEVYRRLTYDLERFWGENDRILAPLFRWFRLAALGLALEVILLLAAVSDNLL
jgi:hypothetical protein